MNHDFLMSGSAGAARSLVRLANISNINLDPAIRDLAQTDLLTDADFAKYPSFTQSERSAIQNIIDYDFRAVFPHQGRGSMITLLAARLANVSPIFVVTNKTKMWKDQAAMFGLKLDEDFFVMQPSPKRGPDSDLIRHRRHGLLIVDDARTGAEIGLMVMDFPKSVIMTDRRLVTDLTDYISILFPGSPSDILTNNNGFFKREIEVMGFKTTRPADLAFLMNVVTDLMLITQEPETDAQPPVDIDPELYARLERNIKLGHLRLDD